MGYDHNNQNNYDHLKGTEKRAHEGSQSVGNHAGGNAGWKMPMASNPTSSDAKIGSGGKHDLGM